MSSDDDETKPHTVYSRFWLHQWVRHKCAQDEDPGRGLIKRVIMTETGILYIVQWTIATVEEHDEIELEAV